MVKYNHIIKAIENTLQKHSVIPKIIRQQIIPVLKSIKEIAELKNNSIK